MVIEKINYGWKIKLHLEYAIFYAYYLKNKFPELYHLVILKANKINQNTVTHKEQLMKICSPLIMNEIGNMQKIFIETFEKIPLVTNQKRELIIDYKMAFNKIIKTSFFYD